MGAGDAKQRVSKRFKAAEGRRKDETAKLLQLNIDLSAFCSSVLKS
jgi:hypothetical protein